MDVKVLENFSMLIKSGLELAKTGFTGIKGRR